MKFILNILVTMCFTCYICAVKVDPTGSQSNLTYCYLPDGRFGSCKLYTECQELYDMQQMSVGSSNYTEVLNFLRKAHCSTIGGNTEVCCPVSNSLLPDLTVCGSHAENKIFGGEETKLDEFPWTVLMEIKYDSGYTGFNTHATLISSRYVVATAKHIVGDNNKPDWKYTRVRLGEYDTTTDIDCLVDECAPLTQDINIESILVHEGYNSTKNYNDIALVRLAKDVEFSDYIKPICLPLNRNIATKSYAGSALYIAGWGTKSSDAKSERKTKLRMPVHSRQTCERFYGALWPTQFCAGGVEGKGPCFNDGGPIMGLEYFNNRGNWYLIGIDSLLWAYCGSKGGPTVYTHVGSYTDWIIKNIKK